MRIGILGTGNVGQALGKGFIGLGHEVKMGSRDPQNAKMLTWVREMGPKASGGTFAEATSFGELIALASLGVANADCLSLAGLGNFRGKVVIDTTNPLDFSKGAPALAIGHTDSGGEQVQRILPDAHVVKAFNTAGNAHMVNPTFPGGPPDMFICGNNDAAKATVAGICRDFGWGVVDLGGIDASRYLEPMCLLWVLHGVRSGSWNHAFKLLQR